MQRVTPSYVFLRPPDKLVLEIQSFGRYREIEWTKSGRYDFIGTPRIPNEFTGFTLFREVFFVKTTTFRDTRARYFATILAYPYQRVLVRTRFFMFNVIQHGMHVHII